MTTTQAPLPTLPMYEGRPVLERDPGYLFTVARMRIMAPMHTATSDELLHLATLAEDAGLSDEVEFYLEGADLYAQAGR